MTLLTIICDIDVCSDVDKIGFSHNPMIICTVLMVLAMFRTGVCTSVDIIAFPMSNVKGYMGVHEVKRYSYLHLLIV